MLYLAIDQHSKQITVCVRNADGDTVHGGPARTKHSQATFAAIDRDSDGLLSFDEFAAKSRKAIFLQLDGDADEQLTFQEFTILMRKSEQIEAAKPVFVKKDADGDERLSLDEFLGDQKKASRT